MSHDDKEVFIFVEQVAPASISHNLKTEFFLPFSALSRSTEESDVIEINHRDTEKQKKRFN